jgi:outer membrane cobalamin receptor
VQVLGGRAQRVEVRLSTRPVELAPVLVSVEPRRWFSDRAGLEDRIERGNGIILTRTELDLRQPTNLGDAMRGLPGVTVFGSGGGITATYTVQLRNATRMDGVICQPMVWVDGQKWGNDGSAFTDIHGFEVEAVEIYRGPSEVPGEFSGGDANCGVVVVWTRRGFEDA